LAARVMDGADVPGLAGSEWEPVVMTMLCVWRRLHVIPRRTSAIEGGK
jgi:hypothetical protein